MVIHILTYQQVKPQFLDLVMTFGNREYSIFHTTLRHEHYLAPHDGNFKVSHLGRSGLQFQHCFNIFFIQPDKSQPWVCDQIAIHHSFDVSTDRAFWILIKGDKLIRERGVEATRKYRELHPDAYDKVENAFVMSVKTHLILLQWSTENWSDYLDYLQDHISPALVDTRITPVAEMAQTSAANLNEAFSFGRLQQLYRSGDDVAQVLVVLEQSKRGLADIRKYYKALTDSNEFMNFSSDKVQVDGDLADFFRRVKNLERDLENYESRASNMYGNIEKHMELVRYLSLVPWQRLC